MLAELGNVAAREHLDIFGALHTSSTDDVAAGTLVLFGPREPGFWPHFQSSPEWQDGTPDPMDRWSRRVITDLARNFGGQALFPFGTPLHPFVSWAIRSGRAWSSPVHLLVHDQAGLMVSYRGAVLIPSGLPLPTTGRSPCLDCETRPCLTACPAAALTATQYEFDACRTYLDTAKGLDCMEKGCAVRRSCPISVSYGRMEAQSAFHMERFHR